VTAGRPPLGGSALHRYQSRVARLGTVTTLGGLTGDDLDELVVRRTGRRAGPRLQALLRGTSGNPFFASELLDALATDGSLHEGPADTVDVGAVHVPVELRARLNQDAVAAAGQDTLLLRAAAVIPGGFSAEELAELLDRPLMRVLEGIVRLEEAHVLGGPGDRLAFRHDIIRQSVVAATPSVVARALNRRAVAVLEGRPGTELRVADCLLAGADATDPADRAALVELGMRLAPHRALAAVELLAPAIPLLDGDDPLATEATLAYGWALVDVGRAREVGALLDAHFGAEGPEPRPVEQLRGYALALCGDIPAVLDRYPSGYEQAIPAAEIDPWLVGAVAEVALLAVVGGRVGRARELVDWVEGTGVEPTDHGRALVQQARAWLLALEGAFEGALAAAQDSLTVLKALTTPTAVRARPHLATAILLDAMGHGDQALGLLHDATRSDLPAWNRSLLHFACSLLHYHRGEWDDALAEIESGVTLADEMELRLATCWPYGISVLIAVARGELADARRWLERSATEVPPGAMGAEFLGYAGAALAEADGDRRGAAATIGAVVDAVLDAGAPGLLLDLCADAQRLAVAAGDDPSAARLGGALDDLAARTASPVVRARRDWVRGLGTGDAVPIRAAAGVLASLSRRFESARAHHDAAVVAAAGGDHDEARQSARAAFAVYDDLGADHLHARLRSELRARGLDLRPRRVAARPSQGWASLTITERQIAELVGTGMTNSAIADRMFVSRRTVESHLARLYPKLGLGRRTQLVAALHVRRGAETDGA
jgi:DNA-binding CsgD family transcriptional regulator